MKTIAVLALTAVAVLASCQQQQGQVEPTVAAPEPVSVAPAK